MDYKTAVKEKMTRQKEQEIVDNIFIEPKENHSFQETFYIQDNYEPKQILFFKYNKKIGTLKIPIGLCQVCNKLEVEHQ